MRKLTFPLVAAALAVAATGLMPEAASALHPPLPCKRDGDGNCHKWPPTSGPGWVAPLYTFDSCYGANGCVFDRDPLAFPTNAELAALGNYYGYTMGCTRRPKISPWAVACFP